MLQIVNNSEHYTKVIERVKLAKKSVWIGTANVKDMYIKLSGSVVPFLRQLNQLALKKVSIRLLYANEPGPNFRNSLSKYPQLKNEMQTELCPRVNFKIIIIDSKFAYLGSANLTGAAMGIKSEKNRNFETGLITDDPLLISQLVRQFTTVWQGTYCQDCGRSSYCSCPIMRRR